MGHWKEIEQCDFCTKGFEWNFYRRKGDGARVMIRVCLSHGDVIHGVAQ